MNRNYKKLLFIVMTFLVLGVLSGCVDDHDKSIKLTEGNSYLENPTELSIQFPDREYSSKDATFLRTVIFPKLEEHEIGEKPVERVELYTIDLNEQEDGTLSGEVKGLAFVDGKKYNLTMGVSSSTLRLISAVMVTK